jgi:RimJ/RimL family protein N-acetyltransferase
MFAITPRLLLRPSWPEDAAQLHNAVADENIVRNLASAPWPYTLNDAAAFAALQHAELYPNAILWTRNGGAPELVGSCGLAERNGVAELGYWIARPYWGKGYATEAARAVVNAARALGHKRLIAGHFADNPASGNVLRKVGFRATGKVELRESRGRNAAVPCVLFEQDLEAGNDSEDAVVAKPMRITPRTEISPERRAA